MLSKKKLLVVACLSLCVAASAFAEEAAPASPVTANVSLVSNYLYRGISQSGAKPALQGGFDYTHASGFYAGVWGSSISWLTDNAAVTGATSSQLELDTYFGFKNAFATDFNYDVGFLRYNYPANEVYGALGYKWLTAKYSYSLGNTFGIAAAKGTNYFDLSANYPIADTGITLGAHYGKQSFKGINAGTGIAALSYSDYKLSVTKDFSGYALGLAYSSTNAAKGAAYNVLGKDLGKGTAVLSLTHAF
jgi:uncharacterized protein (TIGR02001 family)